MSKECSVLIFDISKGCDLPSSELRMEIDGDLEKLWKDAADELNRDGLATAADQIAFGMVGEPGFRVRIECGDDDSFAKGEKFPDLLFYRSEEMLILSLLHCWESVSKLRELNYKGTVYKNIKYIEFLEESTEYLQQPMRFAAQKDGNDILVYFLGDAYYDQGEDYGRTYIEPLSRGVVEVGSEQMYIGTYYYHKSDEPDRINYDEETDEYYSTGYTVVASENALHIFLETDGKDVTFSVLLDGRLYKKISQNEENIIFYDTPFNKDKLSSDEWKQGGNIKDIVFKNTDGKYLYSIENKNIDESRFSDVTITPPQMPDLDSMTQDCARGLFEDYIRALYDAFSSAEEYKTQLGIFKRGENKGYFLCAETDDFVLTGKWMRVPDNKNLEESYDILENPDVNIRIERAVFTESGIEVVLLPNDADDAVLEIDVNDATRNISYHEDFEELSKRSFFSHEDLPETFQFKPVAQSFAEDIEIYRRIKAAIVDYGIEKFVSSLGRMVQVDYAEMKEKLYGDGMIPDEGVVAFAVRMKNKFNRTGKIPHIALIGEAGSGKTRTVEKLASEVFGLVVMEISPSDLKGAYLGQTEYKVVKQLADAAKKNQIVFIDEAYELMSDKFGREAVSLLLPIMSGDRKQVEASLGEGGSKKISIDFEKGIIKENSETDEIKISGVPPIWIAGYEDDIRLMISQNQGLFRRLPRVGIKPPATDELCRELNKKLEDALDCLEQGKDSKLFCISNISEEAKDEMKRRMNTLLEQFKDSENEKKIERFFRWGRQPQNSKYFANHAGVDNFLDRCLDGMDADSDLLPKDYIDGIIDDIKRDIQHQIDTIRRKGINNGTAQYDDSERVEMVFENNTRFDDLIGCDSQIRYMKEIINMFVKKEEYEGQNITVPKGVLLLGAPGVGKTFIAKAMAGELQQKFAEKAPNKHVGFMSLSAPELTSKPVNFIGNIFDKAAEYDVCVIFIDEVDAIAKNRFQNHYYNHFIELIKQMDGVNQRSNVFILAATNAYESLDPAFIRSGRIDKKLLFTLPDSKARCKLAEKSIEERKGGRALANVFPKELEKGIPKLAKEIAAITRGYTPKDIQNVINTAFIMYDQKIKPDTGDIKGAKFGNAKLDFLYSLIYEAVERNNIGEPNKAKKEKTFSVDKNDQSCSSVSIHEVGHALAGILYGCEPFEKITSLPRGNSLGYVMPNRNTPLTKRDYENHIRMSMGGRIAEEIVYGKDNISAGASNDMKQATFYARMMVEELGFTDEFEFMALTEVTSQHLDISEYNCSEMFREQSDKAVNELLKKLYQETKEMLADKKDLIIILAEQVFKRENMTGKEFIDLYKKQKNK